MNTKLRSWLVITLIASVCVFMAWRVLNLGMSDYYAKTQSAKALAWHSEHPEALFREAERLANEASSTQSQSIQLARHAISVNPLDGRAYRVLGQMAERQGHQSLAVTLFQIAARRAPRDLLSQAWLVNYYLRSGAPLSALPHIDIMLRAQPELASTLFPQLMAFASHAQTQPALGKLLDTSPPWRAAVLARLCRELQDNVDIQPLIEFLRNSSTGLSQTEQSIWLERLIRERHWGQAYRAWISQRTPSERTALAPIFNGGFELTPSNDGFDWRINNVPGARVDLLPTMGAGGEQALRVSFEDRRVSFNGNVRQLLVLPQGQYQLKGRVLLDDVRNERGLVWTLHCAEDAHPLTSTEPFMGSSNWHTFAVPFEVPAQNCGGQWLQLSLPARIPAEQQISGEVWFDDLSVSKGSFVKPLGSVSGP